MGKALVVKFADGETRVFPDTAYSMTNSAGVLEVREKYQEPEWWVCFNLRFVKSYGREDVDL